MKDIGERDILHPGDIEALVRDVFLRAGLAPASAGPMARSIRRAETAGLRRLGLGLVPHMVEHLRSGRVDGRAAPRLTNPGPASLHVDAGGGFACPAVAAGLGSLADLARSQGIAILSVANAYPVGAGLLFLDHCADHGLLGVAQVAGLVARATPNGGMTLDIEPRLISLTPPGPLTPLPVIPDKTTGATPPFEGPLGAPFRLHHAFIALRPELWPRIAGQPTPPVGAVGNSGIAVSPGLLEKIINA